MRSASENSNSFGMLGRFKVNYPYIWRLQLHYAIPIVVCVWVGAYYISEQLALESYAEFTSLAQIGLAVAGITIWLISFIFLLLGAWARVVTRYSSRIASLEMKAVSALLVMVIVVAAVMGVGSIFDRTVRNTVDNIPEIQRAEALLQEFDQFCLREQPTLSSEFVELAASGHQLSLQNSGQEFTLVELRRVSDLEFRLSLPSNPEFEGVVGSEAQVSNFRSHCSVNDLSEIDESEAIYVWLPEIVVSDFFRFYSGYWTAVVSVLLLFLGLNLFQFLSRYLNYPFNVVMRILNSLSEMTDNLISAVSYARKIQKWTIFRAPALWGVRFHLFTKHMCLALAVGFLTNMFLVYFGDLALSDMPLIIVFALLFAFLIYQFGQPLITRTVCVKIPDIVQIAVWPMLHLLILMAFTTVAWVLMAVLFRRLELGSDASYFELVSTQIESLQITLILLLALAPFLGPFLVLVRQLVYIGGVELLKFYAIGLIASVPLAALVLYVFAIVFQSNETSAIFLTLMLFCAFMHFGFFNNAKQSLALCCVALAIVALYSFGLIAMTNIFVFWMFTIFVGAILAIGMVKNSKRIEERAFAGVIFAAICAYIVFVILYFGLAINTDPILFSVTPIVGYAVWMMYLYKLDHKLQQPAN